jgi:hypothetical protein|tara:strand:- start:5752 stop:6246 length:495 start_codon:yes stop_codon:yes gene_type:complete
MARRIKISQIAEFTEGQMNKLVRAAVLEGYKSVVSKSPVDTGRFRVSWAVGQNDMSFEGAPAGQGSYPSPDLNQPNKIGYQQEKVGNVYNIYNNLPYADKLEFGAAGSGSKTQTRYNPRRVVTTYDKPGGGSSIQTGGPGWVRASGKRLQNAIPRLARQISAES